MQDFDEQSTLKSRTRTQKRPNKHQNWIPASRSLVQNAVEDSDSQEMSQSDCTVDKAKTPAAILKRGHMDETFLDELNKLKQLQDPEYQKQVKAEYLTTLIGRKYPYLRCRLSEYFCKKFTENSAKIHRNMRTSKVSSITCQVPSDIDELCEKVMDPENYKFTTDKLITDVIPEMEVDKDNFDRMMSQYEFFMTFKYLFPMRPFTPIEMYISLNSQELKVNPLLNHIFSSFVKRWDKYVQSKGKNKTISFYHQMRPEQAELAWFNIFMIYADESCAKTFKLNYLPASCLELCENENASMFDFYSKLTFKDKLDVLDALIENIYDESRSFGEACFQLHCSKIAKKMMISSFNIYKAECNLLTIESEGSQLQLDEELKNDPTKKEKVNDCLTDIKDCARIGFEKDFVGSKLGTAKKILGYKSVEFFGFIHDPRRVYLRCNTFDDEYEWKYSLSIRSLVESINGFINPELKNTLNNFEMYSFVYRKFSKKHSYQDYLDEFKNEANKTKPRSRFKILLPLATPDTSRQAEDLCILKVLNDMKSLLKDYFNLGRKSYRDKEVVASINLQFENILSPEFKMDSKESLKEVDNLLLDLSRPVAFDVGCLRTWRKGKELLFRCLCVETKMLELIDKHKIDQ
ncbi:unnamed protein product [Moneuplotes crassus]|uniref:Uncharacterized protein n=1 Tax=Euplotes crassus TaxID=5936 RepID=A0AAD1Y923_EUPCR|nr:unnamed protein product [Moneuplotes crassus]